MRASRLIRVLLAALAAVAATLPAAASAGPAVEVAALVRGPDGVEVRRGVAPAASAPAVLARLRRANGVLAADVDVELRVFTEPLRPYQWPLDRLEAERVWPSTLGAGAVVAVVDSGVDGTHPDLRGALVAGLDLIDPGGDGSVDAQGHGTGVAGAAAALLDGQGMAGLAPEVAIMPVRVVGADGTASSSDVAEGVVWAADHGADVVNVSLGGPEDSSVLREAAAYAVARGSTVVAAAGNEGESGNPIIYPAAYPEVIAVGATDRFDAVPAFSSSGDHVDLAAPGVEVVVPVPGPSWGYADGTSFAAPYVAAAAALLRAREPELSPAQVAARLAGTAEDLDAPGADPRTGRGLVDPVAALGAPPEPQQEPSPQPSPTAPPPEPAPMPPPEVERVAPVVRVGTDPDPARMAVEVSREAFPADGTAEVVVIGRDDVFADSLGGAALAGRAGPVLFTPGGPDAGLRPETAQELSRVLAPGGTVHLLGGPLAVSDEVERAVRELGFAVERHAGADRYETALAIAERVDPRPPRVLLARGDEWADAVTGGAYAAEAGVPVLLTPSGALHPAVDAALAADRPEAVLLGGPLALADAVLTSAARHGAAVRVFGADRAGTAAAIARQLWGRTTAAPGDAYVAVEGYAPGSWAPALAGAVLPAPELLLSGATTGLPAATGAYLEAVGHGPGTPGTATLVGPALTDGHAEAFARALGQ